MSRSLFYQQEGRKLAEKAGLKWNELSEDQQAYWMDVAQDTLEDIAWDHEEEEEEDR